MILEAKIRLDQESLKLAPETPLPGRTFHDLRRTLATGLANAGVLRAYHRKDPQAQSESPVGVAGIYNRHEYLAEREAAIEAWDQHVATLVGLTQEVGH